MTGLAGTPGSGVVSPLVTGLFFRFMGPYYEWMMAAPHEREIRRAFVDLVDPRPDERFVEFGCGPGNLAEVLAPRCRRLCALDPSASMLRRAARRLRRAGLSNVDLVRDSVESFRAAEPFDGALGAAVLYLFGDPRSVLARMAASVHPGGRVATLDPGVAFTAGAARDFAGRHALGFKSRYVLGDWARAARFYRRFGEEELGTHYLGAGLGRPEIRHALDGMVVMAVGRRGFGAPLT